MNFGMVLEMKTSRTSLLGVQHIPPAALHSSERVELYLVITPNSATYLYTQHQKGEKISKGNYRDDFLISLLKLTLVKHPHGKYIPSLYSTAEFFHSFYIQVPTPYHKMLTDVSKSSEVSESLTGLVQTDTVLKGWILSPASSHLRFHSPWDGTLTKPCNWADLKRNYDVP